MPCPIKNSIERASGRTVIYMRNNYSFIRRWFRVLIAHSRKRTGVSARVKKDPGAGYQDRENRIQWT
jgi:hypothetical protein